MIVNHSTEHETHHRVDFRTCPHCGKMLEPTVWDALSHTLILQSDVKRDDCFVVYAECPDCFNYSWAHMTRFVIYDLGKPDWEKAAKEELKRRTRCDARAWATGLCGRCKKLTEAKMAWRRCTYGCGPVMKECEEFEGWE